MKKILSFIMILMAACTMSLSVCAESVDIMCYITDEAELLSYDEWAELEERADEISEKYSCGVYVIVLEDYTYYGDDLEELCGDIYEYNGLGLGNDGSAVVLILSMEERDYWLRDFGNYPIYAITDFGHESIKDSFLDNLGDDDWYGGFSDYLEQCAVVFEAAESGEVLDYPPTSIGERIIFGYLPAFIMGLIAAAVTCGIFKKQMKTAVKATSAAEYVAPSGVDFRIREDRYSHTTTSRRRVNNDNDNDRGGGGSNHSSGGKF